MNLNPLLLINISWYKLPESLLTLENNVILSQILFTVLRFFLHTLFKILNFFLSTLFSIVKFFLNIFFVIIELYLRIVELSLQVAELYLHVVELCLQMIESYLRMIFDLLKLWQQNCKCTNCEIKAFYFRAILPQIDGKITLKNGCVGSKIRTLKNFKLPVAWGFFWICRCSARWFEHRQGSWDRNGMNLVSRNVPR